MAVSALQGQVDEFVHEFQGQIGAPMLGGDGHALHDALGEARTGDDPLMDASHNEDLDIGLELEIAVGQKPLQLPRPPRILAGVEGSEFQFFKHAGVLAALEPDS